MRFLLAAAPMVQGRRLLEKKMWPAAITILDRPGFAERADKESWPAARFLAALAEHENAGNRKTEILDSLLRASNRRRPAVIAVGAGRVR